MDRRLSFGSFVSAGVIEVVSDRDRLGADGSLTAGIIFLVGSAGILLLLTQALRASPLSLQEEWNLVEEAARATARAPHETPRSRR